MIYFTLQSETPEDEIAIPAGATLAIDDGRQEIIEGRAYAVRFPDGRHGLIRVKTAHERVAGEVTDLAKAKVIGELVDWWPEPVTRH